MRFVELQRKLGVGRDSLRRALDALIELGFVERNTGYGHPLRPEYVITAEGRTAASLAARVVAAGDPETLLRKWSVPVLAELDGDRRFSELRASLPGVSPRALAGRCATSSARVSSAAKSARRARRRPCTAPPPEAPASCAR